MQFVLNVVSKYTATFIDILSYVFLLLFVQPAFARPVHFIPEVYFIVVGSGDYLYGPDSMPKGFTAVESARDSARRVAGALENAGAAFGILLTSDEHHFIGVADVRAAIIDVKRRIRRDNSQNPLIFFYYMGHGLGDHFSEFLYLPPGNLGFNTTPSQVTTLRLNRRTLPATDIISSFVQFRLDPSMSFEDELFDSDLMPDPSIPGDLMRYAKQAYTLTKIDNENRIHGRYPAHSLPPVPFIALFDNCYGSVVQNLADGPGGQTHAGLADEVSDAVVLFATSPGHSIGLFADPSSPNSSVAVGSLARRFLIAMNQEPSVDGLTIAAFRNRLETGDSSIAGISRRDAFPSQSPPPYAYGPTSSRVGRVVLLRPGIADRRTQIYERFGTATTPILCCQ